jgi:two-component system, NarL family, captular synthesis response regulator RcsB
VPVTDLAMPGGQYGDGLSLIGYLRRNFPDLPIVVLTMLDLSHIGLAVQHVERNLEYMSPSVKAALETLRMNENAALLKRLSELGVISVVNKADASG